jgi:hypothetical protein
VLQSLIGELPVIWHVKQNLHSFFLFYMLGHYKDIIMTSIAVQDLKRPRELRDILAQEREVFVTKDGRPFAIMIGVDVEAAEETLREVRRAMFSASVARARSRARVVPITDSEIEQEITAARKQRMS